MELKIWDRKTKEDINENKSGNKLKCYLKCLHGGFQIKSILLAEEHQHIILIFFTALSAQIIKRNCIARGMTKCKHP